MQQARRRASEPELALAGERASERERVPFRSSVGSPGSSHRPGPGNPSTSVALRSLQDSGASRGRSIDSQ
eukprot:9277819-Alexandrium_andersonii.AAC.1